MNFLTLFNKPNLIAAHRGDRSRKPENTLSAFCSSIGRCDFIETDVQLSKDLVPVIMHDDTLGRTTNVREFSSFAKRYPWYVKYFTLDELQCLDYGSWFDAESKNEPLLTLEKALSFIKEENIFLNVEIKDMHSWMPDKDAVKIVADSIKKIHAEPLVMLSSFYHPYLPICKEFLPDVPTAVLMENTLPDNLVAYLDMLHADAFHPDDVIIDKKIVREVLEAGYFVNVYTVNDPARKKELFNWGVNGVFTDYLP